MKTEIIPSIIAKNQKEFNKIYNKIKIAKTIHLDVMDGRFVKKKSMWFDFKLPKHNFEAHLMTTKPETFIERYHNKIKKFIVHVETVNNPDYLIKYARKLKSKIFFALEPKTPVSKIKNYLNKIDGVMIMTVEIGSYGAKFIPNMINKIKQLRKLNKKLVISADGSVNEKTIKLLKKAGASTFSVGSYIQKSRNAKKSIEVLTRI